MAKKPIVSSTLLRLHRVTDLFKTGEALTLNPDADEPVVVWVQKLNNFQRQDALRDAEYGRSRRMAALSEDTEEIQEMRRGLSDVDDNDLIDQILQPKGNEFWAAARDDVTSSEDWTERIQALRDHGTARSEGSYIPEGEEERLNKISTEYLQAIQKAADTRTRDAVRDMKNKSRTELEDEFIDGYRKLRGLDAWQDEFNRTELWYALRDCVAGDLDPDDHAKHAHPQLLDSRRQIYDLPDELIDQVTNTLRGLAVPAAESGNSVAPRSSSESSERPGTEEDSTPSTPEATSLQPAGTSSTPSPVP